MEGKTNASRYSPIDIARLHATFGYEQNLRPVSIPSLLWGFESLSSTSEPPTRGRHDNCAREVSTSDLKAVEDVACSFVLPRSATQLELLKPTKTIPINAEEPVGRKVH